MLHSCSQCRTIYLVSDYRNVCQPCGHELQQRIELLDEGNREMEWWVEISRMAHGEPPEIKRRWRIG